MPSPAEPESLDLLLAQICYLHYIRAHQLFEAIGLYRGQPPLLEALWRQEGLTHTELAEKLKISPSTITKMLQRMEKTGFIVRKLDTEDQRVSRVYLTEAGRAVQAEVKAAFKMMEAETFGGLTTEEHVLLRRFLLQMRGDLERVTGKAASEHP